MIANAGSDERGQIHGGKAGDQTKTEYRVRTWYNRPWTYVLRPNTAELGAMIADISRNAANNDHIGYDQYERKTYYNAMSTVGWKSENIKVDVETDCSDSTITAIVGAGHRLKGYENLQKLSPDLYTGNMRPAIMKTGHFTQLTDKKYLSSDAYLLPGDILLYEGNHVAVNLSKGACASVYPKSATNTSTTAIASKKSYSGTFPTIPKRGYFKKGDKGEQVKNLQRFLNWYGGYGLVIDGIVGTKTIAAVKKFQKAADISVDGQFGSKSLSAAKNAKK